MSKRHRGGGEKKKKKNERLDARAAAKRSQTVNANRGGYGGKGCTTRTRARERAGFGRIINRTMDSARDSPSLPRHSYINNAGVGGGVARLVKLNYVPPTLAGGTFSPFSLHGSLVRFTAAGHSPRVHAIVRGS